MSWVPSPFALPAGGRIVGNTTKKPTKQRLVLQATLVGPTVPNRWSCRLECGHVAMVRSQRGTKKPRKVYCPECQSATQGDQG